MSRRLVLSYLGITVFVMLVLEIPLGITFARRAEENLYADIERDARVLATAVEDRLEAGSGDDPTQAVADYAADTGGRAIVVDSAGIAIADSDLTQPDGRDFSTRPEIIDALGGRLASGSRPSDTLNAELLYVAVPVASSGRVLGAVRITYPRSALDARIRDNWIRLGLLGVSVVVAAGAVGWLLARSVSRPLHQLQLASAEVARGDVRARVDDERGPPEVRQLARSFNTMSARVASMLEHERAFTGDVSHQLRTPLTALRLRLESLELSVQDASRADVEAAIAEVERLTRLIDALLALARVADGQADRTIANPAQIVDERLRMWTPLADERSVALRDLADGSCRVFTTPGALDQILDNLLSNALEVSAAGSTITVSVSPSGGEVWVSVRDQGPGMSDADMARAFDRFFTTGGTGLGLAIVQRLALASGGTAFLRRPSEGGLEAGVRLPSARLH